MHKFLIQFYSSFTYRTEIENSCAFVWCGGNGNGVMLCDIMLTVQKPWLPPSHCIITLGICSYTWASITKQH